MTCTFKTCVCAIMAVVLSICAFLLISKITRPGECSTTQALFRRNVRKYLANHVVETKQAGSENECGMYCVRHRSCASANYKTSGVGKGLCELNNKKLQEISDADDKTNLEFNHLDVIKVRKQQASLFYFCYIATKYQRVIYSGKVIKHAFMRLYF